MIPFEWYDRKGCCGRGGFTRVRRAGRIEDGVGARSGCNPGWITIRLKAAALNWHDILVRQDKYSSPLPHVLGADGAGTRTDTGEEVLVLPSLWWGDRDAAPSVQWEILGDHQRGTYAELVRVPKDCVAPKPHGLSWEQTAALPLVGLTTYRALFTRGRLRAGENLLVLGAGGGVATMAVMLAFAVGANVTVTSSSASKIAQAVGLGAANGVLYTNAEWPEEARQLTPEGQGFDLVLDSVGTWEQSITALRPGGRLVVLGATRNELATLGRPALLLRPVRTDRDHDGQSPGLHGATDTAGYRNRPARTHQCDISPRRG